MLRLLSPEVKKFLALKDETEWHQLCSDCVYSTHDLLKALQNEKAQEGADPADKSTEELTAEAMAFDREGFLARNAVNTDFTTWGENIDPVRAVENLRLLFALKFYLHTFDKVVSEHQAACATLSITNKKEWETLLDQVNNAKEQAKPRVLEELKTATPLVINRKALKLADIDVREVLETRWGKMNLLDALEQDGDQVWEMMDAGGKDARHCYAASEWTEDALGKINAWELARIMTEQPKLLSKGVLTQEDILKRFNQSWNELHREVCSTLADTGNLDKELFEECKWLLPDAMHRHIKTLYKGLKEKGADEYALRQTFKTAALKVGLNLPTDE